MSEPTPEPMSSDRLEEIRSVIEQAPQLVTDGKLTTAEREEARWCGCGDEHTAESLCPNCQTAHDVQPTDRAIDRIVLRQRDDLLADVERLRVENERLAATVQHLDIVLCDLRAAVLDAADAIAGRPLTRAETDLLTQTLRTAAGDS